jgi:hypothetical protein
MDVVTKGGGTDVVRWWPVEFSEEQQPWTNTSAAAASEGHS